MNAIVTGSFDPFTLGHLRLVEYAVSKYDKVYVVALINKDKSYMFSLEEKKKIIELSISGISNVVADAYDGLTADYMHAHDLTVIVRGIRNKEDDAYEKRLAEAMSSFDSRFKTDFYYINNDDIDISSSEVRKRLSENKSIVGLVHDDAIVTIEKAFLGKK